MRVFIGWSGARSGIVARELRDWLQCVIQAVDPWVSQVDIPAGKLWLPELQRELIDTSVGILCVTKENRDSSWMAFEAGVLARNLPNPSVIPFLIGMREADLREGPLAAFQAKVATREGTLSVVGRLNDVLKDLGGKYLDAPHLKRSFEAHWPELERALDTLPPGPEPGGKPRDADEMVQDILEVVRGLARRQGGLDEDDMVVLAHMFETSTGRSVFDQFMDWMKRKSLQGHAADQDRYAEILAAALAVPDEPPDDRSDSHRKSAAMPGAVDGNEPPASVE